MKLQEILRRLQEAHNAGEWLEARLHLMFTEIADSMFGDGYLTREERIALSSAIGAGLDSFRAGVEAGAPQLYTRSRWADPATSQVEGVMSEAAIDGEFVALVEQAVRRDGTIPVKLITPGWGSSGYYPAEVLERDGPAVFKRGTKSFWNHPTPTEEAQRPEGDLNALAAELVTDARYEANGVAGPGLYADAKVFEAYQGPVNDLASHIGMSIRASGRAVQGEAEGRKGPIIQQIVAARSVDFVTEPGAGGQIVQMFEAARRGQSGNHREENDHMSAELQKQLKEAQDRLARLEEANARLREAQLLRDARDHVAGQLAHTHLPDVTKRRLVESLSANPPVTEAGALDIDGYVKRIEEAIKAEAEYLATATGGNGRITGMGSNGQQDGGEQLDEAKITERMEQSFRRMGLSESGAKQAAAGRVF